jgi:hypothetical protein
MPLAPECQAIADDIAAMEGEKRGLQQELQTAAPGEKPAIVGQIKSLIKRISAASIRLTDCINSHAGPPPAPPLDTVLNGTATMTTTYGAAPGPFTAPVSIQVTFNGARTFVAMTSFPPITATFSTPLGKNTCTITRSSGGTGSYAAGTLVVPITLHFDQSIDLPFYDEDSDLPLILTTSSPGAPVDGAGHVVLAGTGTFTGGVLGGSMGSITLDGTFATHP